MSDENYFCQDCLESIPANVYRYSMHMYGLPLCRDHQQNYPTEGEEIIEEFFKDKNIKYIRNKEIRLQGDSRDHRKPDFFLPKFKLYVEFLGQWQTAEHKDRYKEKMRLYDKNHMACVYLYPENLGVLEQIFHIRAEKELKLRGMRKELVRFLIHQLGYDFVSALMHLLASSVLLFLLFAVDLQRMNSFFQELGSIIFMLSGLYWLLSIVGVFFLGPYEFLKILFSKNSQSVLSKPSNDRKKYSQGNQT